MDPRLRITETLRPGVPSTLATIPLVSLAWRALRGQYQQRAATSRAEQEQERRRQDLLADVGEEVWRLRQSAQSMAHLVAGPDKEISLKATRDALDRVEAGMAKLGLAVLAPQGEPYDSDMMELFDNVAQRIDALVGQPRIVEVISPAMFYKGELIRMGKAVVAIPGNSLFSQYLSQDPTTACGFLPDSQTPPAAPEDSGKPARAPGGTDAVGESLAQPD
jgi:hypothetical protein